jgi:hypothetical protein
MMGKVSTKAMELVRIIKAIQRLLG